MKPIREELDKEREGLEEKLPGNVCVVSRTDRRGALSQGQG